MKLSIALILFVFGIFPLTTWAGVHLIAWQPQAGSQTIVLPRLEDETPTQAVQRYLENISADPGLASLRPKNFFMTAGQAVDLPPEAPGGRLRLAMIANRFRHLTTDESIQWTSKRFSKAGANPFVIGLSADLGLPVNDAAEYRRLISLNFSLLVSLGGDDIAPEVYGEENTFSHQTNAVRDQSELALVKSYKQAGRGVFFGICRGHQMGAVADGHGLAQDLTQTGVGTTSYHGNSIGKEFVELQTWHHIIFQDSLLSRFLIGKNPAELSAVHTALVNSVHHQAVVPKDQATSYVIALDDKDAIVEALQGKNMRSFSVQFHPEIPANISGDPAFSKRGFQILQGIVAYARLVRMKGPQRFCSRVHG